MRASGGSGAATRVTEGARGDRYRTAMKVIVTTGYVLSLVVAFVEGIVDLGVPARFSAVTWMPAKSFALVLLPWLGVGAWLHSRSFLGLKSSLARRIGRVEGSGTWARGLRRARVTGALLLGGLLLVWIMTEAMPWTKPVRRFYCTLTAVLCAGWSLGLHAWSAGRAALRASGARLRGPLADLMLTPLGPGLLPRAAFLSRARRAVWTVFSLSPLIFAGVLALTAKPLRNLPDFEAAVSVILVAAALVWVEYLSLRAATALGIWAGYAVPAPGLSLFAGVLASSVFWVVRVLALIASSGLAAHCASHRGADMVIRVWFAVPACMLLATAVTVVALRAAGASMTAPLMLRFGAWAVRRGETMMGMGAACGRGRADLFPASERPAAPAGGRLPGGMLWLIIGAIAGVTLVLFAFSSAIAADTHFVNWQSGTKARVIFVLAFALYGVTAALFIRHLRKSRLAAESKKGAAS